MPFSYGAGLWQSSELNGWGEKEKTPKPILPIARVSSPWAGARVLYKRRFRLG